MSEEIQQQIKDLRRDVEVLKRRFRVLTSFLIAGVGWVLIRLVLWPWIAGM